MDATRPALARVVNLLNKSSSFAVLREPMIFTQDEDSTLVLLVEYRLAAVDLTFENAKDAFRSVFCTGLRTAPMPIYLARGEAALPMILSSIPTDRDCELEFIRLFKVLGVDPMAQELYTSQASMEVRDTMAHLKGLVERRAPENLLAPGVAARARITFTGPGPQE